MVPATAQINRIRKLIGGSFLKEPHTAPNVLVYCPELSRNSMKHVATWLQEGLSSVSALQVT